MLALAMGRVSRTARRVIRGATSIATCVLLCACAAPASRADLDRDNPVRPPAAAPFGMEDFFAEAPRQPDPVRARLGRWLFYDARLSADGTVSCATCHRPAHAFSEPLAVSVGVAGRAGRRKAMSIVNLAARTTLVDTPPLERSHAFFWDGRALGLEAQVLGPLSDRAEMGLPPSEVVARVTRIPGYLPFFREAFGAGDVTIERIGRALADYVRTLRTGGSAYDRWAAGAPRAMSEAAQRGSDIFFFRGRCASCHAGFNFSDGRYFNLGVGWDAASATFRDDGRAVVTGNAADRGRFKTPGLRDVTRHAPYMHDGSLSTLRDVVEFYNRGGNANPWRTGRLAPLGLTSADLDDLIAFLEALDSDGVADSAPRLFPQ